MHGGTQAALGVDKRANTEENHHGCSIDAGSMVVDVISRGHGETPMKKIALGCALLLVVMLVVIVRQPAEYHVVRSMSINAPPSKIYEQVVRLQNWEAWSPWAKIDPNMVNTYTGPESGLGASHSWSGNNDVGEGKMTIIETTPHEIIRIQLEFIKPFASTCETGFFFVPDGSNTLVMWTMSGNNDFMGKAFSLFMDMDTMIGQSYELGLSNLAQVVANQK